jgi:hypothetical protein
MIRPYPVTERSCIRALLQHLNKYARHILSAVYGVHAAALGDYVSLPKAKLFRFGVFHHVLMYWG